MTVHGRRDRANTAVAVRLDAIASEVTRTREAVEAHEQWHRDQMVRAAESGRMRRIMIVSLIVSAFAAASAVAGEITTVIIRLRRQPCPVTRTFSGTPAGSGRTCWGRLPGPSRFQGKPWDHTPW